MKKIDEISFKVKEYINNLKVDLKKINKDNILFYIRDRKYLIIIILLFIVFFIGGYGKINTTSREELIDDLEVSMKKGNSRKINGKILISDEKVSKSEIDPLIKYYNQYDEKVDNVINELEDIGRSGIFEIKSNKHGIWKNYYLEVDTVYLKVNTNFEDAKIFINNNELQRGIENMLIPGMYTVKAMVRTDYGDIEKEIQVPLMEDEEVFFNLDGTYLNIISNFKDSKVLINDKYTNKNVSEIGEIGPVPTNKDLELQLEREFPWGVIKSDKVKISNSPSINIDINMVNEELTTQIESTINRFYESVFNALNERDYNLIVLTDDEIKKKIYDEINKKSLILKNNYEVRELDTKIENSEFKYEDNIYKAQIVVKINYSVYKKLFLTTKEEKEVMFHTNMELISDEWVVTEVQKFTLE